MQGCVCVCVCVALGPKEQRPSEELWASLGSRRRDSPPCRFSSDWVPLSG